MMKCGLTEHCPVVRRYAPDWNGCLFEGRKEGRLTERYILDVRNDECPMQAQQVLNNLVEVKR